MKTKKRNALFGRYPSCDMLNNALRFLFRNEEHDKDHAMSEIIYAIQKADGYFYKDIEEKVKSFNEWYWKTYRDV